MRWAITPDTHLKKTKKVMQKWQSSCGSVWLINWFLRKCSEKAEGIWLFNIRETVQNRLCCMDLCFDRSLAEKVLVWVTWIYIYECTCIRTVVVREVQNVFQTSANKQSSYQQNYQLSTKTVHIYFQKYYTIKSIFFFSKETDRTFIFSPDLLTMTKYYISEQSCDK